MNFQRADWVRGSLHTTFQLAWLVEITHIHEGGELFSPFANRSRVSCRWLRNNSFLFDGFSELLAGKASYFVVQSGNNFRKPFHPHRGPLTRREQHFHRVLVAEQALSQGAVETFNDSLVAVNFRAPAANVCLSLFHFFCCSPHEYAPGVDLQHFWPRERRLLVNLLEGLCNLIRIFSGDGFSLFVAAGHFVHFQRVLVNLAPSGQYVMRQKKKVRLVNRTGGWHVEFRTRNAPRRGDIYLRNCLPDKPFFGGFFRDLGCLG